MALRWIEGFDNYDNYAAPTGYLGNPAYSCGFPSDKTMVAGRFGGQALQMASVGGTENVARALGTTFSTFTLGCAFKSSAAGTRVIGEHVGPFGQFTIRVTSTGAIEVVDGLRTASAVRGTSTTGVISYGVWQYVEYSAVFNGGSSSVKVDVDGVNVLDLSGIQLGGTGIDTVGFPENGGGITVWFDDVYFRDDTTMLGPCQVEVMYPDSDVALGAWAKSSGSTGYSLVNESITSTANNLSSSTLDDECKFGLGALSATGVAIRGVMAEGFMEVTASSTIARQVAAVLAVSGTDYSGGAFVPGTSYNFYTNVWEKNPATGAPWSLSDLAALDLGVKITS